jgi:hypothetical protein
MPLSVEATKRTTMVSSDTSTPSPVPTMVVPPKPVTLQNQS